MHRGKLTLPFNDFLCYRPPQFFKNSQLFPSLQTTQWLEILQRLCLHDKLEVQHRGLVVAYNLINADQELAKKLVESELLEILTVVGKQADDAKKQHVINVARECLVKCMDYGLIKPLSQA